MTKRQFFLVAASLCGVLSVAGFATQSSSGEDAKVKNETVYEMRTYITLEGRLPALHARFKNHTMKLFEKHGMKNIMYWTPLDEVQSKNTLIYVIAHDSMDAAKKSWDGFRADPEWHKARDASEKDGKIVDKVISVYMKATDYSPLPK